MTIILCFLFTLVGSLIEFCCYVRKRNAGLFAQDAYTYADMYNQRDSYEYVKFVLYLQDSYDGKQLSSCSLMMFRSDRFLIARIHVIVLLVFTESLIPLHSHNFWLHLLDIKKVIGKFVRWAHIETWWVTLVKDGCLPV